MIRAAALVGSSPASSYHSGCWRQIRNYHRKFENWNRTSSKMFINIPRIHPCTCAFFCARADASTWICCRSAEDICVSTNSTLLIWLLLPWELLCYLAQSFLTLFLHKYYQFQSGIRPGQINREVPPPLNPIRSDLRTALDVTDGDRSFRTVATSPAEERN